MTEWLRNRYIDGVFRRFEHQIDSLRSADVDEVVRSVVEWMLTRTA